MIKRILILMMVVALLTACGNNKPENAPPVEVDAVDENAHVLVFVNEEIIEIDLFNKYYAMQSYDFEKEYGKDVWNIEKDGKTMKEIRQNQTLDYMIRVLLIKDYVVENGFKLNEKDIDEVYEKYMDSKKDDDERLEFFDENGMDESFLKTFLRDQLYLRTYREQILEGIYNNQETMTMLFEDTYIRYKTNHILVDHDNRELLDEIRIKILDEENPVDFSVMAREHSIHSTSAVRGGDLGYITIGNMPSAFEEAALTTELYTVSDVVETEYGYHLLFVEDRQMVIDMVDSGMPEDEINTYKDEIINAYASQEYIRVFETLKANASIEVFKEKLKGN